MDSKQFTGKRWIIAYGNYEGAEGYAVNELYKVVQQYVPYILTVKNANTDFPGINEYNVIFIGTIQSNMYIREFADKGLLKLVSKKEGYAIRICKSPFNQERQAIIIAGYDENGVLYGVRDFEHYYANSYRFINKLKHKPTSEVFTEELPHFEYDSAPVIPYRGLWTWGHVIYDYKRYLDNMSKWKMNIITIWNDYAPLNARQVVEYAHSRGIKVIWGFSWCWGEVVNPLDPREIDKWTKRVIDTYENQYHGTGADGIYFQTFTETIETRLDGLPIAKVVTDWINSIAGKLLEKYPDLWIHFGLHATSIKNDLGFIADVDPRISIVWEDVGSFPYSYDPACIEGMEDTLEYTSRISNLRGASGELGVVIKGCTTLDWLNFEHQKGSFILGEAKDDFIRTRAREKSFAWRYIQAHWIKNLEYVSPVVKNISGENAFKRIVELLVEDGMWEEHAWCPVAFCAEMLWNPHENPADIIKKVSLASDTYFA